MGKGMTFYKVPRHHKKAGQCWRYALACILNMSPKKVPNFVRNNSKDDDDRTRKWLKTHNKSMVYLPINLFMEVGINRANPLGGPDGYSIMIITTTDPKEDHAVIAKDGKFCYDPNTASISEDFQHPIGFYLIHDV